jgi:hypothetical protein
MIVSLTDSAALRGKVMAMLTRRDQAVWATGSSPT